jgi:hypothetical protein
MDNLILQAQEEAWGPEELETVLLLLGEESAWRVERRRTQRRTWLRGAGAFAMGLLAGGLLFLILRLWGWL